MNNQYLPKQLKEDPEFMDYQDVISVLFDPETLITKDEARQKINEFLNKEVN